MWSLLKSNDNSLSIQLLEPVIFIGSQIHTSPVLRGIISIFSLKTSLVNRLTIQFQGIAKIKYILNNKFATDERLITRKDLTLYSKHDDMDPTFNSGSTALFSFELPLPTGLPETVQSPQIQVGYQFTLDMDYTRNQKRLHQRAQRPIIIARLPQSGILSGENVPEMIDCRKHISPWCQYRITLQRAVALGSVLPIHFELAPIVKGLKLKHVFAQLLERRTVVPEVDREKRTSQSCFFLHPAHSLQLPSQPLHHPWEASVDYKVPHKTISHSTETYRNFAVNHLLLISFVIHVLDQGPKKTRYTTKTICFTSRIDLLDKHSMNDTKLPPYHSSISTEEMEELGRHGIHSHSPPNYHAII